MNFDDYVNYIRKKYRLALAVTIIQNKPENITTLEYIENLRKNIENKSKRELHEISINSKDFLYEDDDVTTGGKEINNKLEPNKEKTTNFQQNNKASDLNDVLFQENSVPKNKLVNTTNTVLNEAKTNKIGQEINYNIDNSYEISYKPLNKPSDILATRDDINSPNILDNFDLKHAARNISSALHSIHLHRETNNILETHTNMISPDILDFDIENVIHALLSKNEVNKNESGAKNNFNNFDPKYAAINYTHIINNSTLHIEENDVIETHNNMTSPNILENFDIENIIQAHTVSKDIADKNGDGAMDDFLVKKQPHKKAKNTNTKELTKLNLIIEDTQLIDSDDDPNLTDCEIANNSINNKTDENNNNNVNFNTQTTYCDESQLATINLINEDEYNDKAEHYLYNNGATKQAKTSTIYLDLPSKPANLKSDSHTTIKDKDFSKTIKAKTSISYCDLTSNPANLKHVHPIINNEDFLKAAISNKNPKDTLKRKLHESHNTINDKNMLSEINRVVNNADDSQATELYTIYGPSQGSHISQSQVLNTYNIDPKHISKAKQPKIQTTEVEKDYYIQLSPEIQETTEKFDSNEINLDFNKITENDHSIALYKDTLHNYNKEQTVGLNKVTKKTNNIVMEEWKNTKTHGNVDKADVKKSYLDDKNCEQNIENAVLDDNYTSKLKVNTANNEKLRTVNENPKDVTFDILEITNNDAEVIPFKVIEEMNRVKVYITRNNNRKISVDGLSADSGFISDSQIKSSLQLSAQSSQNWLNQSAHCLLEYLLKCPLLTTNMDFTEQISVVLCELIDKLHAEENYPPFLDLILKKIELFLDEIINGYDDNSDSKIEKIIHTFLLLNKSINIIKYSLEKLTNILEKTHENLTKTDPYYEITNPNETQKLTYIFHILEIILKRYFKQKDGNTQNTQPNENLTKKTSITDIWRAKWNSKFKSFKELPSKQFEKEDVTEKMAVVLNKIIINCMEGYSLVSFAALQCFNLLQT